MRLRKDSRLPISEFSIQLGAPIRHSRLAERGDVTFRYFASRDGAAIAPFEAIVLLCGIQRGPRSFILGNRHWLPSRG